MSEKKLELGFVIEAMAEVKKSKSDGFIYKDNEFFFKLEKVLCDNKEICIGDDIRNAYAKISEVEKIRYRIQKDPLTIKLKSDNIFLESIVIPMKEITESGVIIPGSQNQTPKGFSLKEAMQRFDDNPLQGVVVAAGPGFDKDHPMTVEVGDHIYINQPPDGFIIDKKGYSWVRLSNVIAIKSSMEVTNEK